MSRHLAPILSFSVLSLALLSLLACGSTEDSPVGLVNPNPVDELLPTTDSSASEELEAITIANAQLVQEALETWAVDNSGVYPGRVDEANQAGVSLVDLLPEGQLLLNAFTEERTEPRSDASSAPGAICFSPLLDWSGVNRGYTMSAYGLTGMIWTAENFFDDWGELERRTVVNATIIQIAIEDWSWENGGNYPSTAVDRNSVGHTMIDYLPAGRLLENPFTLAATEPVDAVAATSGQVGYITIMVDGYRRGYTLNGWGYISEVFHWNKSPPEFASSGGPIPITMDVLDPELFSLRNGVATRTAVRRWSAENGGGYPTNLADANQRGHTLVDLLPGGILLINSSTGARTEPRNGAPASPGAIGYHPPGITTPGFLIEVFGNDEVIWSYAPLVD